MRLLPIVVDVSGKGFVPTRAQDGVKFDISGTGNPIQKGGPHPVQTTHFWLYLDLMG